MTRISVDFTDIDEAYDHAVSDAIEREMAFNSGASLVEYARSRGVDVKRVRAELRKRGEYGPHRLTKASRAIIDGFSSA